MPQPVWRRPVGGWSLDGRTITLGAPPLHVLVGVLVAESPLPLIFATTDDAADADWIARNVLTHRLPDALLDRIADRIAVAYFGRPRWQTIRIWNRALGCWPDLDGELLSTGVDLMTLAPDRATNVAYRFLISQVRDDKAAVMALTDDLTQPPPDVRARELEERSLEEQAADWETVAALAGMG